jgi:hypothetical protein
MSLIRLIYYGAIVGGWAAFLGWLAAEYLIPRFGGTAESRLGVLVYGAAVGACIGAGLNLLAGMANGQLGEQLKRIGPGLVGGAIGGMVGALLGDWLYVSLGVPRALGWLVMGSAIGVVEGLYERSTSKLRNGLIGGSIGGLVGGVLFDVILKLVASQSGVSSRATAFVILGLCIGVLIATVQVMLKQAWLTVVDGYRPGRELILSQPVTALGRGETLPLPFFGAPSKHVEPEHARISRKDGQYVIEDNHTRIGTIVNKKVIDGPVILEDGDVIRLGNNVIRFHEKPRRASRTTTAVPPTRQARSPGESRPEGESNQAPIPPAVAPPRPAAEPPTRGPAAAASAPPPGSPRPASPSPRPAPARIPAPAPPVSRTAPSTPSRPAAPPPPSTGPTAVTRPSTPASQESPGCPGCGRVVAGPVGKRYCPACHRRF